MNEQLRKGLPVMTKATIPSDVFSGTAWSVDPLDLQQSLGARLLEFLASMANEDGVVSPAEYECILSVAQELDSSCVSAFVALHAIEYPKKQAEALDQLRVASSSLSTAERQRLFQLGLPMLELQGDKAQAAGGLWAKALGLELTVHQMKLMAHGAAPTMWKSVTSHSMRRLKGRDVLSRARESMRFCCDPKLSIAIADYLDGKAEIEVVEAQRNTSIITLGNQLKSFSETLDSFGEDIEQRRALFALAEELVDQIEQRVAIVISRIELERNEFNDEFEDLIHDAGNAFELEVRERMDSSSWKLEKFWGRVAKGPFARELERRLDRIQRRYSERLRHLQQEVIHFSKEYQIASGRLLNRHHHSGFSKLMPGLRLTSKIMGAIDTTANVALGGGLMAGVGAGAAMYFLGAAAVLPLLAPAAPIVGGAILFGSVVKFLTDSDGRANEELAQKRVAFEQALRLKLDEHRINLFKGFDAVQADFVRVAQSIAGPTMAEAKAQLEIVNLQQRVGRRVMQSAQRFLSN